MLRFLLILIALVVLLRLLGWTPPGAARRAPPASSGKDRAPTGRAAAAELVACAQCGVYLPVDQALAQDGLHFCCAEHRRQGARAGRPGGSRG